MANFFQDGFILLPKSLILSNFRCLHLEAAIRFLSRFFSNLKRSKSEILVDAMDLELKVNFGGYLDLQNKLLISKIYPHLTEL